MADVDKVSFILEMVDKASTSSKDAEKALKSLNKELGLVEAHEKKANGALSELGKGLKKVRPILNEVGNAVISTGKTILGLASAAGGLVLAGELYALHAADFQDRTLAALGIFEGSEQAANKTLDSLRGAASKAGLRTEQVTKFYQELRAAGFQVKEVQAILAGGLDVGAVMGQEHGDALIKAVEAIRSKGKLDSGALEQLKMAGIGDPDALVQALGEVDSKFKGKDFKAVKLMMDAGQVDAATGTDAILKVIQSKFDKGKALGTAAINIGGNSVEGQIAALHNQLDSVFADTAVKGPFLDALKEVGKLLDGNTETGKALRETLGGAFKSIAETIKTVATPENIKSLVETLTKIVDISWKVTSALFGGLAKGFMAVARPVQEVWQAINPGKGSMEALVKVAEVLGIAIGGLAAILGIGLVVALAGVAATVALVAAPFVALGYVVIWLVDQIAKFAAWLTGGTVWKDIGDTFTSIGKAIVDGIVAGLKASKEYLKTEWNKLVDILPDAAANKLKIKSPSRVMMQIGDYTALGLIEGIHAQNDNARAAMTQLVAPDISPAEFAPPTIQPGAISPSRGQTVTATVGELHVHVHVEGAKVDDPRAFVASISPELRKAIIAILQGAVLEGAAA